MPHLVGQGKLTVQGTRVVQQHIRMHRCPGGVGAAALAHVLVHVNPPIVKALLQDFPVLLTQGSQTIVHRLLGLVEGNLLVHLGQQRSIDVIEVKLFHSQQLLAQADIPVHLVQIPVNRLDQVQVYRGGHLGFIQGGFKGRGILSRLGKEFQLLILSIQNGGRGIAVGAEGVIQILISALAKHPVTAFLQADEGSLAQRMLAALRVHGIRERNIRIRECAVNCVRCLSHLPGGSQQLFLGSGEGVGLSSAEVVQISAIPFQLRAFGIEPIQGFLCDFHDFRGFEAGRRMERYNRPHKLALHGLIDRVAGVLVCLAHAVIGKKPHLGIHPFHIGKVVKQYAAAFCQPTRVAGKRRPVILQRSKLRLPGLIRGIHILRGPPILHRDFLPHRDFSAFFHIKTS